MSLTLTAAITNAAAQLGLLDSGEGLSTQQIADGLFDANNMLDNWSSEQNMVLSALVTSVPLTNTVSQYTIGPGGVWLPGGRPMAITAASHTIVAYGASGTNPVKVLDLPKFLMLPDRNSSSLFVRAIAYDRGFPQGTVYVSPVPVGGSLTLTTWQPLTQFADTVTPITVLPGYERMIVLGLAIESCPRYNMNPSETLVHNFQDAVARVRTLNAQILGGDVATGQTGAANAQGAPIPGSEAA